MQNWRLHIVVSTQSGTFSHCKIVLRTDFTVSAFGSASLPSALSRVRAACFSNVVRQDSILRTRIEKYYSEFSAEQLHL